MDRPVGVLRVVGERLCIGGHWIDKGTESRFFRSNR